MYLANNNTLSDELFRSTDLRTVYPDQSVIFTGSNRGRTYRLFDNPHHRRALASMGLRPETAFGCAFRFLFEPNAFVKVRQTTCSCKRRTCTDLHRLIHQTHD